METVLVHPHDFAPQPGPQTQFLASAADITVMGGAAFVGKTWAEVCFPLRYAQIPGYTAAIYRQRLTDVVHPGGLWDEAAKMYPALGGEPNRHEWSWKFPRGGAVRFAHVTDEERIKGSQIGTILLDEGTHFEEDFFWGLLTRNRSTVRGVPAQLLMTTNPDADSWVADFLALWIDQDASSPTYGEALPSMAGRVLYMVRHEGVVHWFRRRPDTSQLARLGPKVKPSFVKSVVFIPGKLEDNKIGLSLNPAYEGNLASADPVTVARLLYGNWKVRRSKGNVFKSRWITDEERHPRLVKLCRGWDLAATEGDGDWTVGVLLGEDETGVLWVLDVVRLRGNPGQVERLVKATAEADGRDVPVSFAWERAGAGKSQVYTYTRLLQGWAVTGETESGPHGVRAAALSAQAAQGRLRLLARSQARAWEKLERAAELPEGVLGDGFWQREYLRELEAYPEGKHDDQVAATLAAFRCLSGALGGGLTAGEVAREYQEGAEAMDALAEELDPGGIGSMEGW